MLNRLIGESPVEVGKSVVVVFLAILTVIALQQLAATRSGLTAGQGDRSTVIGLAGDFGQAMTTYDYAHPDVLVHRLTPLATPQVVNQVKQSFADLRLLQAVSVGDTPDTYLQSLDAHHAEVLVRTRSTLQSANIPPGTHASGLMVCDLDRQQSGWRVSSYEWLTPAAQSVS